MGSEKTVLVVDDSVVIVQSIGFVLGKNGYRTLLSYSVDDALKLMEANAEKPPNLVLTDLNMQGKDGFELVKALKANPKWAKIPVLMLTTESSRTMAERGKELGLAGWMVKPFNEGALLGALRKLVP